MRGYQISIAGATLGLADCSVYSARSGGVHCISTCGGCKGGEDTE